MKLLLDTHTLLWFTLGDSSISGYARSLLEDSTQQILVSPASYWEIAIKVSLGKFRLLEPYDALRPYLNRLLYAGSPGKSLRRTRR